MPALSESDLAALQLSAMSNTDSAFDCESLVGDVGMRGAIRADYWEAWPVDPDSGAGMPEFTGRGPTAVAAIRAALHELTD